MAAALPRQHEQWEPQLEFLPAGRLLTSAQRGETLVWDARAGRILRRYPVGGLFALSPDGRRIAIARNNSFPVDPSSSVTVLNLRTGENGPLPAPQRELDRRARLHAGREADRRRGDRDDPVWDVAADEIVETYGATRHAPGPVVLDHRGLRWTAGSTAP